MGDSTKNSWNLPPDCNESIQEKIVDTEASLKKTRQEAGLFGRIFGIKHPAVNLACFVCSIFAILFLILSFVENLSDASANRITSIITLILGYLFGEHSKKDE